MIATYLTAGQTGKLFLTRTGPVVTLTFDMLKFDGDAWVVLGTLPEGFRPPNQHPVPIFWGASEAAISATSGCILRPTGPISFRQQPSGFARATISYTTLNAWPSALPGTAA